MKDLRDGFALNCIPKQTKTAIMKMGKNGKVAQRVRNRRTNLCQRTTKYWEYNKLITMKYKIQHINIMTTTSSMVYKL